MLIEFSVSNFKSIREKQTLSMVAASRLSKKQNVIHPNVPGEKLPPLLKAAAIYGPNASGKSTLVEAMGVASFLARMEPIATPRLLPVSPFRFDPKLAEEPSTFEIHFIQNDLRYQYAFSLTAQRIHSEKLVAYPRGKEDTLYERTLTNDTESYSFSGNLEGGKELHNAWRNLTGPQTLFLAQAVANSNDSLTQLRNPFNWLTELSGIDSNDWDGWARTSQNLANRHKTFTSTIATFLQQVDVPVTNIKFEENETAAVASKPTNKSYTAKPNYKTILTHTTALGDADFDFSEESSGTKNLIGLWLPWSLLEDTLAGNTRILLVDEFDSSLHPELVTNLVKQHLASTKHTQIIFTTHNTHLMNAKLLRRDQFWLTERDANGATQLRSLHDFAGREGEDIEKRYFEGRYRSLPYLREK
ncbi:MULTISPECIES: AAA family ATPase [Pseudomonas]|uniref:AAA family ATPase n=1 Tax=Pseudomonas TaxID=286 RepID=UPI0009ECAECF|nr:MULTISPECIES: ATP-binding protein [Pseudomonas]WHS52790.1 ATP-binding protein [Pseudomonas brassicacearum]